MNATKEPIHTAQESEAPAVADASSGSAASDSAAPPARVSPEEQRPLTTPRKRGSLLWLFVLTTLALMSVVLLLWLRGREHKELAATTEKMATPTVNVIRPQAGPTETEIVLPANLNAFSDAAIYARTSGYLKVWHTDIGARVKEGQVIAEIEAPDVDAQLLQATANLSQAKANLENAKLNFDRQKDLRQKNVSSQQEFDQNRTALEAMQAAVQAGEANVQNLTVQKNFQKILAPFPGVVTKRNTDVGALITAGSGSSGAGGQELFHLARTDTLRAFIYVPQVYSPMVALDTAAYLEFAEFPGEKFYGKIANVSGALDPATRTLLTEVQVSNTDGRLFPGAFANVHLILPLKSSPVVVSVNALLFRSQGTQVGVVDDNGVVHLKKVAIGRDFGTSLEIVSGLDAGERVIINPSDSLADGTKVQVQEMTPDGKKSKETVASK